MGEATGTGPLTDGTKYRVPMNLVIEKGFSIAGLLACGKCSSLRSITLDELIFRHNNYNTWK